MCGWCSSPAIRCAGRSGSARPGPGGRWSEFYTTYGGGPAGLEAIAASIGEDALTLEDVVEPYLLQVGFLARTRQGRRLTVAAFRHLGMEPPARAEELFD
jgi:hypothetical protein